MLARTKVLAAAVTAAASILPATVATPAAAMSPCQARAIPSTTAFSQTVVIAGAYTAAGATDVSLTCGVVRNGVTYARRSSIVRGPAAVVAGFATTSVGTVSSCHELRVVYADGNDTYSDTCP